MKFSRIPLGKKVKVLGGYAFKSQEFVDEGVPILRISNIVGDGAVDLSRDVVYYPNSERLKDFQLDAGDIVIAMSGATTGKVGRINKGQTPCFLNQRVAKFVVKDKDVLNDYLFFILRSPVYQNAIWQFATGCAQPNISSSQLESIEVALPGRELQQRIVALLSKIESVLEKRRQTLRLADEFLKSAFLEMFGEPSRNSKNWPVKRISDVLLSSQYGTSKKSNSEGRGYIILGMGNISYKGELDLSRVSFVDLSEKEFEELKLMSGDIIFNRTNSTELVGKTACWKREEKAVLASYLVKLKLKADVVPEFFTFLLNTSYYKNIFMQRCKKAVGQSNISPTLLREFEVFLPPRSQQQKFADLVQKVERLKEKQKQSETQLQNLFNSLMQRAFRGELLKENL